MAPPRPPPLQRNHWQSGLLDERFWVILFVVAILSLSISAILLVYNHNTFLYGDGSGLRARTLFTQLSPVFEEIEPGICEATDGFGGVFTAESPNAATFPAAEWFAFVGAGINIFYALFILYMAVVASYGLVDIPGWKGQYWYRRGLLLLFVPMLMALLSGTVIQFGIDGTCSNLPASGCYLACCTCPQVFCNTAKTQVCTLETAEFPQEVRTFNDSRYNLEAVVIIFFCISLLEAAILVLLGFLYNAAKDMEVRKEALEKRLRREEERRLFLS